MIIRSVGICVLLKRFYISYGTFLIWKKMEANRSINGDYFNGTSSNVQTSFFFDDMFTKAVLICAYSTVFSLCFFGKYLRTKSYAVK